LAQDGVLRDQPGVVRFQVADPHGQFVEACRQPNNDSGEFVVGRTLTAPARHHPKIIP
jgi:hypothetical protein